MCENCTAPLRQRQASTALHGRYTSLFLARFISNKPHFFVCTEAWFRPPQSEQSHHSRERESKRERGRARVRERERSQTTQHTTNNTHVRSSSLGAKRHKRRGSDKDRRHAEVTPHPAGFIVGRGLSLSHNKGLTHQACNKRLKTVTPTVPATLKTVTPTVPQLRCNSAATPLQLLP